MQGQFLTQGWIRLGYGKLTEELVDGMPSREPLLVRGGFVLELDWFWLRCELILDEEPSLPNPTLSLSSRFPDALSIACCCTRSVLTHAKLSAGVFILDMLLNFGLVALENSTILGHTALKGCKNSSTSVVGTAACVDMHTVVSLKSSWFVVSGFPARSSDFPSDFALDFPLLVVVR